MLPGLASWISLIDGSRCASRVFRFIPASVVHKSVHSIGVASGHLLGRTPCGLSRVLREARGWLVPPWRGCRLDFDADLRLGAAASRVCDRYRHGVNAV